MEVDDEEDEFSYRTSSKIEELPDDVYFEPALSSRQSAYIVQSPSDASSVAGADDSMEDVEPLYRVRNQRDFLRIGLF